MREEDDTQPTRYNAYMVSHYWLRESWGFFIYGIEAYTPEEALDKSKVLLATLSGNPSPVYLADTTYEQYWCLYNTTEGKMALAVTPWGNESFKQMQSLRHSSR